MTRYADIAYTDSVRAVQEELNSPVGRRLSPEPAGRTPLTADERLFVETRDGFYLGTTSETGWPYIQYRGGPPGFLHVVDGNTIAFADVRGNRQYISTGNVRHNDRVALFLMDYPSRSRLKIFGRMTLLDPEQNAGLADLVRQSRTDGRVERIMSIAVEAHAWNCHQHITPRYSEAELEPALAGLRARLDELEAENRELRRKSA
ncbi:pyridoxamine 5-phosphate oxidase [Pseudonocardiaceae bacterium YIM PH 21723]|nr:pyridoxamine 5-phosphate oxidase [Pseudonocardiaceae bacterium YIM PH 21723]